MAQRAGRHVGYSHGSLVGKHWDVAPEVLPLLLLQDLCAARCTQGQPLAQGRWAPRMTWRRQLTKQETWRRRRAGRWEGVQSAPRQPSSRQPCSSMRPPRYERGGSPAYRFCRFRHSKYQNGARSAHFRHRLESIGYRSTLYITSTDPGATTAA